MNPRPHFPLPLLVFGFPLALAACGLPTTRSDVKFAGVGLNPDEVGTAPTPSGGFIEYNWVEFAGGQLSLAALGLLSFDEAGPDMVNFEPPYAVVNGTGFVFDTDQPSPDALFGSFSRPPDVVGSCQTVYDPRSYLSNVADVGDAITLNTQDESAGFRIERRPYVYGPLVQRVFPNYSQLGSWRTQAWTHAVPTGKGFALTDMQDETLARPNFPFGQEVQVDFPGGVPPVQATYDSIPMPLAAADGNRTLQVPARPEGFMLQWTGPRFDSATRAWTGDNEAHSACLQFQANAQDPTSPADCTSLPTPPADGVLLGQVYTPPWKTADGVTLSWAPDEGTTDTLSVTVRFLGRIDETKDYFVTDAVDVAPTQDMRQAWAGDQADGTIPQSAAIPTGKRPSLACDDPADVNWEFDPTFKQSDGSYIPTLQGDPLYTLAEVTCTLDPAAGQFTITPDMLGPALAYAKQYRAGGAVFYVARTQTALIDIPPVRDYVGKAHDLMPITAVSKAVQVGRFWYDQ